jgi:predicted DNA-binding transcriptional regulator AlpA
LSLTEDLAPFSTFFFNRDDEIIERLGEGGGVTRPVGELLQFRPTFFSSSPQDTDFNESRALICTERLLSSFQLVADDPDHLDSALLEIQAVIAYDETLLLTPEEGERILNFFEVASVVAEVQKLRPLKEQPNLRKLIAGYFRSFQKNLSKLLENSAQESAAGQDITSAVEGDVGDHILSLEQVAEITKIASSTLYKRKRGGNYPPLFKLNGMLVCKKSELEAWLKTIGDKSSLADETLY